MVVRDWRTTTYTVHSIQIDSPGEKISYEGADAKRILRACDSEGKFRIEGEFGTNTCGRVKNVFYMSLDGSCPIPFSFREFRDDLGGAIEIDEKRIFSPKRRMLEDYVI